MKRVLCILSVLILLSFAHVHALDVTPTGDASILANNILGSGITISNITYTGGANASGTFTNGLSSGIGIASGIILTTGSAADAVGPNSADNTTTENGLTGDSDLDVLIPGFSTFDATILEFDFESAGGNLFFNYVFASEEYNEWVDSSYNDVFGFFLDGMNIALIPGTTTPVAINNVNNGSHSVYYNNNDPSDLGTPTPFNLEYDGFTSVFTASVFGLEAGLHSMKLAIADAGDSILDSAVFIQGGSFSDTPVDDLAPIPEPSTWILLGSGLAGLVLYRRKYTK